MEHHRNVMELSPPMCAGGDNSLYLPLLIFRYSDGETPTCL